ncbi:hypothetical protein ACFVTC_19000 [Streptomyces sp. NPDC057950]|uniref:hypothetical protein n=1 Tax=Streptomyces sp. NPDC057950 TaxID=3346288 RepID=UPI0036E10571
MGRTSLKDVGVRTIQGVIALKRASRCTITGGTESGHSAAPAPTPAGTNSIWSR